jgi:hypothetical protein
VDVGKVDKDGDIGAALDYGPLELTELAVNARQVKNNFGDAHDGHVFGTNDEVDAGGCHVRATHAKEIRLLPASEETAAKFGSQQRAIVFTAGLTGGDENDRRRESRIRWHG